METSDQMRERHRQVLKYGDVVVLAATDATYGFLSACHSLKPQVRVEQMEDEASVPSNIQDCRFQVLQKFQFEDKRAYDGKLEELCITHEMLDAILPNISALDVAMTKSMKGGGKGRVQGSRRPASEKSVTDKMAKAVMDRVSHADIMKLLALRREMEHERESNLEEFKRSIGDVVMYGDAVQLLHLSSGRYLSVKKTAALVERGNLQVTLLEAPDQGSCFLLKSGYRTRSEGDRVLFSEVVSLGSLGFHGMGLSVGKRRIAEYALLPPMSMAPEGSSGDGAPEGLQSFEVSAGHSRGRFKIIPHSLHPSLVQPHKLNGCSVISLTMGNGEQLLLVDQAGIRFQHMQDRDLSGKRAESVAGHALWRLEPETAEWAGQAMSPGVVCRLRHLASNMLLAAGVDEEGGDMDQDETSPREKMCMYMTPHHEGGATLWKLHSFTSEPGVSAGEALLRATCHVFLQHSHGMWLTLGERLAKRGAPEAKAAATPASVDFYAARLAPNNMDSNVLGLRVVSRDLEERALMMANALFVIQDFVERIQGQCKPIRLDSWCEASTRHIHEAIVASGVDRVFDTCWERVCDTMDALIDATTDRTTHGEGGDDVVRSYQQLSMEMRVIDAVVESLKALKLNVLYGSTGKQYAEMYHQGRCMLKYGERCHNFLQRVVRNSKTLQNYVAPFIEFLKADLGGPVRAADTLAAIYHDNMKQIQMIDSSILEAFIKLIATTGRRPHYLNFLSRVCGTAERPVPGNQNRLSRLLLENSSVVAVSACWDESEGDWVISAPKSDDSTTIKVKCSELSSLRADSQCTQIADWPAAGDDDDKYRLFLYYIYLLDLYRALCHGRNQISQKNLAAMDHQHALGLDLGSLLKGIRAAKLPNALRTALVQVMQVLHIDREPFESQRLPRYIRLLEPKHGAAVATDDDVGSGGESIAAGLLEYAEVCHFFLEAVLESPLSERTRGRNALTMQMTVSVDMMFRLGVIPLESELAARLLVVLEGLLTGYDIHPQHIENRFADKDGNDVIMAVKSCVLHTFNYVLDVQMDNESAAVFDAFRQQRRRRQSIPTGRQMAWSAREGEKVDGPGDGMVVATVVDENSKAVEHYVPWQRKDAVSQLDIFSPKCFQFDGRPNRTVVAMLELIRYDDPTLKGRAISLVERLLSKSRKLARLLMDTQIVRNDDIAAMYTRCRTLLSLLKSQTKWIASLDDGIRAEAMLKCSEAVAEMTSMLTPGERIVIDSKAGARAAKAEVQNQQGDNGEYALDSISDDGNLSCDAATVVISKEHVSLMQAMARDLDAHQVVLTFLKLPLRTKPEKDPDQMPEALEEDRRELFGLCYQFLSHFAGGSENRETDTQNRHNQKLLFSKLPLFMSHLGTRHLNITNTLVAIFAGNSELARKLPPGMIARFVDIIVRYGGKQRARWLRFLQAVVTVDGAPIQRNQELVLSLLDDHEDRVCELFTGDEGRAERLRLMRENEHEVNLEEGKQARGSRLNYHRVTVQLIADCCVGGNPTFVVKASGFLPLHEVLTCLCAPWNADSDVKPSTARFIKSAYCSFLLRVYLMPNTENARMAVSENSDLFWPTEDFYRSRMSVLDSVSTARSGSGSGEVQDPEEQRSPTRARAPRDESGRNSRELSPRERMQRQGDCLMHTVMAEVEVALQEPSDALSKETSAVFYLATHVMPLLVAYFRGHFFAFYADLPTGMRHAYDATIDQLTESIRTLQKYVQDLPAEQQGFLKAWRRACRSIDAALDTIVAQTTSKDGGLLAAELANAGELSMARRSFSESESQMMSDRLGNQEIQAEWRGFISELAGHINVYIDFSRYEAVEAETVDGYEVQYASLWKLARLLTGPHESELEGARPRWSHASAVHCLVKYMLEQQERVLSEWEEETLVKMLRVLRAVIHMDDGVLRASAWQEGWRRALAHDRLHRPVHAKEAWVQDKYAALGLAELGVRYMACGVESVAMEAMYLLNVLMQEGNGRVQDALHALLADNPSLSSRWFAYLAAAFDAYIKYHQSSDPRRQGGGSRPSGRSFWESRQAAPAIAAAAGSGSAGEEEQDLDLTPVVTLNEAGDPDAVCLEVMKLMNLMCEGLHDGNQALLKAQPRNATSTNFIHRAVDVLNVLQSKLHDMPDTSRDGSDDDTSLLDAYRDRLSRGMVTVFRLLNEVVQGPCRENQLAMLVGCPLLLLSNRVLHYTLYDPEQLDLDDMQAHSALKCNLLSLLCGLLEGNRPGDEEIPTRMTDILSTKLLDRQVQILFIIYGRTLDGEYGRDINERVRDIAVKELTLFFSFCDKLDVVVVESKTWVMYREERLAAGRGGGGGGKFKGLGLVGAHAAEFKREYLGSVEVLWKGQVEKVFFPLTMECQDRNLDWQWRERARVRLQGIHPSLRANTIQKGIELMRLIAKLEDDIETDSKLLHEAPVVHWMSQQDKTSNQAAFYLSVVTLCALLVLLPVSPPQPGNAGSLAPAPSNLLQGGAYHAIRGLITVELLCCIFVMCAYLCGDVRRWWVHSWAQPASERAFASVAFRDWLWKVLGLRSALRLMRRAHLLPGGPQRATSMLFSVMSGKVAPMTSHAGEVEIPEPPNPESDRTPLWLHVLEMLLHVSTSFKFWFTVAQITFAALSFLNEFFIVFQLLIFFVEFEAGIMLMGALRVAGASLIRTATMGIIIIVLFAVFGFIFFNRPSGLESEMNSWAGDQPACGSFYQCTFSHLIAGMMGDLSPMYTNDHGELWKYVPLAIQDSSWMQARSFFVILFFIIWGFILSNIFTGQIVDAFASIRDDKRQMDQDTNSKCLVCSIDRFVLEQESDTGFEHHVAADHNPLHYVYYLHYLRKTEPDEYRGCDAYVAALLGGPEPHTWLPIGRALAVEQRGMSSEAEATEATRRETEQMARTVKSLESLVTGIRDRFEERLDAMEARLTELTDTGEVGGGGAVTRASTAGRGFVPISRFSVS